MINRCDLKWHHPLWLVIMSMFSESLMTYFQILFFCIISRFRIPNVNERLRRDSEGRTLTSNLVFTIWAVFGGFILHFLLCNWLTVLLRPRYEEPVETAKDLIKRDIIPFYAPGGEHIRQIFAASQDPNYREIAKRLHVAKNWDEYLDLVRKVNSTGMYSDIGNFPWIWDTNEEVKYWYQSSETLGGDHPYIIHLANKKWPLLKVCMLWGDLSILTY